MIIANYQTIDRICTTAGSDLYRARRLKDGMPVLLKQLDPDHAIAAQSARFKREYLLLQSLDVAEIIKPIALIDEPGCLALVLEDFAGESFEAILGGDLRLDLPVCLSIARHLAHALAGIHAAQVIHQDIRPANILVARENGEVRLADFSIALTPERETFPLEGFAAPTGDWAYLSPEQTGRMNRLVDYRSDFYSLGITLYRMLTGQLPFAANDPLEWAHCHIARLAPPACDIAPAIPEAVSDIVMKLLAKLPEERYQSARGLQADLDRCLAQWQTSGRIEPFPLGAEDVSERFHIPHKLYGRDREIATLLAAFEHMAATGEAALVAVSGYSGIGKSSLVLELQRPIVHERGYFISGKFDQYQRDIPYATITQAFRELVQQLLAESEVRIAGWRQQMQAALGGHGQLIVDVLPQVELIIGKQAPVPALPPTEAQNRFRRTFQQFMAVLTSKEHPLVLFLDDLQWIDAASLTLVEHLLTHPDTRYLLLIGAYRDNEVSAAHPLMTSLDAIRNSGATVIDIRLAPLAVNPLNQLMVDTLHAPPESCEPLTRLVCERTEGNPFFFTQFLDALHKEGLLRQDAQHRAWQWGLDQIKAKDFADNVVDLMVGKLRQLPVPVQEALQLAACLGNKFDLRHLALASRQAGVERQLAAAIDAGLIVRTNGSGKFLHDRIQQAAYSLIPEERRARVHLRIGRMLLANLTADELAAHLFDVANQFNRGAVLIAALEERERVAALNLIAGKRAKSSTAYQSALNYFSAGIKLLGDDQWESRHELAYQLAFEQAESEFLIRHFDESLRQFDALLKHASTKLEKADIYRVVVDVYTTNVDIGKAIACGLEALRLFDIDIPPHPSRAQVDAEYDAIWKSLGDRPIEDLINLPLMTDPEMKAAMDILMILFAPSIAEDRNLLILICCYMVNITIRCGNSDASAMAYGYLGMNLGPFFGKYREGFQYGMLGYDLVEKQGLVAYKAKINFIIGAFIDFWHQPVRKGIEHLDAAFKAAVDVGDLNIASYASDHVISHRLVSGEPLAKVYLESEVLLDFTRRAKFDPSSQIIVRTQRFIQAMQGHTANLSSFSGADFDQEEYEQFMDSYGWVSVICGYYIMNLQAKVMSGDYEAAIAAGAKAKPRLWSIFGMIQEAEYVFYFALALAAHYHQAAPELQQAYLQELTGCQKRIGEWAVVCPENFLNRYALVSAEIARIEGRELDAMHLYEQAVRSARENGFVQNEGIAYEFASPFYRARGFELVADTYLREARSCYLRWGARGKVRQLEARYPQIIDLMLAAAPFADGGAQIDALSITKALQAISGHIVLEELVDTLMRIVLENAGAQTGHLLLVRNEDLVLAAHASVEQQTVQVQLHRAPAAPEVSAQTRLPAAILNYVRRSQEQVLLADVAQPNPFSSDAYFAQHQPKSVLCLPILRQAALLGVLYLENSLVTHAFTPQRVAVLELLASQAAISLENALLYTDLQQENSERKQTEGALREREARIRRLVDSNIVGILFYDLAGNITGANDAALAIIGYSRQDLLAGKIRWPDMTPPEWRADDERAVDELKATGTCHPFEKEYVRKDGSRVPVLIAAAMFEGSRDQGVAFALDLTELKQAEEALRKAHDELERRVLERTSELQQSNRQLACEVVERQRAEAVLAQRSQDLARSNAELEQVAYVASHDLQEPLRMVASYMQLLEQQYTDRLDADAHEFIGFAVDGAKRMQALIDDLLTYSRLGTKVKPLQPTDCAAVMETMLRSLHVAIEESGAQIQCDALPVVMGDAAQLTQLFQNLIANAIKFRGGQAPRIAVRAQPEDGFWRFEVQDNGIGIAPEYFDRIFVMFQRLHSRSTYPGTGIGLAICKKIVERHGGRIWVESVPEQGAVFKFTLPRETGEVS